MAAPHTELKAQRFAVKAGGLAAASQPGTAFSSCAFPSICVLPGGRWLCGYRAAPSKQGSVQQALTAISDDRGLTWRNSAPFQPPDVDGKPGQFRCFYATALSGQRVLGMLNWVDCSDPALPYFNANEGLLDTRIFSTESEDGGDTWSLPRLLETPFPAPTALTGPLLHLDGGRLACQFELNKPYHDLGEWRHRSVLLFSNDGGRTWPDAVFTSSDPENRIFYWDQRPGVLSDGRVLDLFWTYDRKTAKYLNIHARESLDGGRRWSGMWDTGLPGQPAAPVALSGGRIALVYVDRTREPLIKLRVSSDGGRTWPESTEQLVYGSAVTTQTRDKQNMQDAWSEMYQFSVGLPAVAALDGDELLVVFYAGEHADRTDVRWARLAAE